MARRIGVRLTDEDEHNLRVVMARFGQNRVDAAIRLSLSLLAMAETIIVKAGVQIKDVTPPDWC